ncbi:MAG: tRNA (N6-isopentenyl adenosine(37)-C2)-methylthiotransferase MiaB [Armatimonadetes bacterium]|nr:tRNA (N6-isopentenyl adenosine(37)-C2)-methylthiotransferase MiaB [Armatimonadota bacterium]
MSQTLLRTSDLVKARPVGIERGTYFIQTWGCQMNEEDSEQIGLSMQEIGFGPASDIRSAHVILLNTCSVRKKPEDKAMSLLGELALLKQARPDIVVGVCGCMAQLRADEIKRRNPFVDFVIGTGQITSVAGLVEEALLSRRFQKRTELPERKGAVVTDIPRRNVGRTPKLKAFVPIQYGCDKFCTFCIVPTTRGRERSRPTEEIIEEVSALAAQGTREVTLLGQTVNSYGKNLLEGRVPFSQLLWKLAEIPELNRIRYTSPYPRDFKTDLIETIRDCPKVMEHIHMPLQSGDDDILKAMRRLYTRDSYLEIIHEIRAAIPHIAITTDIIVGFPGETEEQFSATLDMVSRVRFDGAYMFIYSPRPDTPAADMDQIPAAVKSERLKRLIGLQNSITLERNASCVGQVFEVLVEGTSPKDAGRLQGYSREFRMMHFPGPAELTGQRVQVRATQSHMWGLSGELV